MRQEFDNKVLNLVRQKWLYPYKYMSDFEKFKEELLSKENFYSSLTGKAISDKEYEHALKVWINIKWKRCKIFTIFI